MKVLVTGGAGYIGSHAVHELKKSGHEPVIFDSFLRGHKAVAEHLGVPIIEGDLCHEDDIANALKSQDFDAVMHFAAVALVSESIRDPSLYYTVNVAGGLKLLNAMRASNCKRLIFSSTCAVYGTPTVVPINEDSGLQPVNPYGHSKLAFEQMMRAYASAYGFRTLALRYFNAAGCDAEAGLGEVHHPETHLIPNVLKVPLGLSRTAMVFGTDYPTADGTCVRDFIDVRDLARIHVLALERLDGLQTDVLNVGTGRGTSVREVIEVAKRVSGRSFSVVDCPRRDGDPHELVASASKAEELLGFRAEISLEQMIQSTWDFMKANKARFMKGPMRFGEAAVEAGLITEADIEAVLGEQNRRNEAGDEHTLFGLIMVEMGLLKHNQLIEVLMRMNKSHSIGQ